jgi:N-acetylmuramoyl-L-alanine amidase
MRRVRLVVVGLAAAALVATTGAVSVARPATAPAIDLSSLRGKVILIDPGHNGANWSHPSTINKRVWVVNRYKTCDTTGTATNKGYPESAFTFDVATRLAKLLRAAGAKVVLTRANNHGVGPCITERAAIGNRAHADAAISIHGDGGPARGYGFTIAEPGNVGPNAAIVKPSHRLALALRNVYRAVTGEPVANYYGKQGLLTRTDLGGLNLSKVPKVFIECGNMRNSADAARMTSPAWRQRAAQALELSLASYL